MDGDEGDQSIMRLMTILMNHLQINVVVRGRTRQVQARVMGVCVLWSVGIIHDGMLFVRDLYNGGKGKTSGKE